MNIRQSVNNHTILCFLKALSRHTTQFSVSCLSPSIRYAAQMSVSQVYPADAPLAPTIQHGALLYGSQGPLSVTPRSSSKHQPHCCSRNNIFLHRIVAIFVCNFHHGLLSVYFVLYPDILHKLQR